MNIFRKLLLPSRHADESISRGDRARYQRIWNFTVILTLAVSLVPLLISAVVNFFLFQKTVSTEIHYDIARTLTNTARSVQFIIEERRSAIELLSRDRGLTDLSEAGRIESALEDLRESFGGFVDLGVIDAQGNQIRYAGPYSLQDANYSDQDWFHEVILRGIHVSDVFLGYRQFPHFVIAVRRNLAGSEFYVLRATVDMALLTRQISLPGIGKASDAFLINLQGVVQTPSRFHGDVLTEATVPVPPYSNQLEVVEEYDERGHSFILGYTYIEDTPFILLVLKERASLIGEWIRTRTELLAMLVVSVVLIIIVVLRSSTALVRQIEAADLRRAQVLHNVEYTSKMATIGRLAASVAHEINNPLAIINEKAGLLSDIVRSQDGYPMREKILGTVESVQRSVERCSAVTHRLLGFTRRMEPRREIIDLPDLVGEVLGFLGKEADHRNIRFETQFSPDTPPINSDRGQLQQIFLNLFNNAVAAIPNSGRVVVGVEPVAKDRVRVTVADNGRGIPARDLQRIFEPFYSTKGEFGTGLGLSITYDLVKRLGGEITVESELGQGTCFSVELPVGQP